VAPNDRGDIDAYPWSPDRDAPRTSERMAIDGDSTEGRDARVIAFHFLQWNDGRSSGLTVDRMDAAATDRSSD
jgi:hypothetical protein